MKTYLGCAQRGRYQENGTIKQQIECNNTEISNAITTVPQKDCLVIEIIREELEKDPKKRQ